MDDELSSFIRVSEAIALGMDILYPLLPEEGILNVPEFKIYPFAW